MGSYCGINVLKFGTVVSAVQFIMCTKIRKLIIYKKFMTLKKTHYFLPYEQSEIARKTDM